MAAGTRDLTRGYARGMLAVAEASDSVDAVENDLRNVADVYKASAELREFLSTVAVEGPGKREALERLFERKIHPIVLAQLGLLAEQGHGRHLPEVVADFIAEAAEVRGRVTAEVTTAVPLSKVQTQRLRDALAQQTGRTVALRTVVDQAIGGGVVVRIGDRVIDGSVRSGMQRLRGRLAN